MTCYTCYDMPCHDRLKWNSELSVLLFSVIGVNVAWGLLLLASKLLGNENTIRKRNAYYMFWRKAHAHRLTRTCALA